MLVDLKRLKKETSRTGYTTVAGGKKRSSGIRTKMIFAVFFLVALSVAVYLYFSKKSERINPDRTQRPLQIPLTDIAVPGISGDGNWIAYGGADQKGTMGLYIMNVIRGDPRFVTTISSSWTYVDLMTDGSLILYVQYNSQIDKLEGYVINSLGGTPRKIIQDGCWTPRFRPDGRRVGYIWSPSFFGSPSSSGKLEFWSVGVDGTDPRREFIDSVSSLGACSFSYSPDGMKIAWVRAFPEKYSEIIIHDLETGEETAITSDKKHADEPVWILDDKIVYMSDRNGIENVWMVSTKGGEPIPITDGTEPVVGVKASINGQKILYAQFREVADFKIVNIPENRSNQITFTEEHQYSPKFSPDGKQIAFIVGGPNDYNRGLYSIAPSHIYVIDRDGSNRRQLSFGDEVVSEPMWSPDGRQIAYGSKKVSELQDSVRTYIIELSNPNSPKYIAHGFPQGWVDSVRIMVEVNNTVYLTSIIGGKPIQVYDDSTYAYFIQGGKYIVYRDLHIGKDRKAQWIVDGTISREEQRKTTRLIPWHSPNINLSDDGKTIYGLRGIGEIWRMTLPDGKEKRIPADFPGVKNYWEFSPSWDGKEIIIVNTRYTSRFVIIENLFK
jgi:Tol biopolymer transport system component